jgi:hypothetical protein
MLVAASDPALPCAEISYTSTSNNSQLTNKGALDPDLFGWYCLGVVRFQSFGRISFRDSGFDGFPLNNSGAGLVKGKLYQFLKCLLQLAHR